MIWIDSAKDHNKSKASSISTLKSILKKKSWKLRLSSPSASQLSLRVSKNVPNYSENWLTVSLILSYFIPYSWLWGVGRSCRGMKELTASPKLLNSAVSFNYSNKRAKSWPAGVEEPSSMFTLSPIIYFIFLRVT